MENSIATEVACLEKEGIPRSSVVTNQDAILRFHCDDCDVNDYTMDLEMDL